MTFASANLSDIEHLITDPNMALEQKFDGTRSICVLSGSDKSISFLQRNGSPLKHTAATQHFEKINVALAPLLDRLAEDEELVLDGEIMIDSGEYILFDMPLAGKTYAERREALGRVQAELPVRTGYTATSEAEKRSLYQKVVDSGGEGVMAKHLGSPYDEGKRVKHSLKIKFTKTADVVVIAVDRSRSPEGRELGSIQFGVYAEDLGVDGVVFVGRCSVIGKEHCVPGDVIEVSYLYRGAGGALVQPSMVKVRHDRDPRSCGFDQFVEYSKGIVS